MRLAVGNRGRPRGAPAARQTMIHRDFNPENTLWSRAAPPESWTGPRALLGTGGLDLGHIRWNLVLDGGQQIADRVPRLLPGPH